MNFLSDESRELIINENGVTCGRKFYSKKRILEWGWNTGTVGFLRRECCALKGQLYIVIRTADPLELFRKRVAIDNFSNTEVIGNFKGHLDEIIWEQEHIRGVQWGAEIKLIKNEAALNRWRAFFEKEHQRYERIEAALNQMLASKDS